MWHWATSKKAREPIITAAYPNEMCSQALIFICVRVWVSVRVWVCVRVCVSYRRVWFLPSGPRVCACARSLLGSHRVNRARCTSMLGFCLLANPHTSHPSSFPVGYQANEMNTHPPPPVDELSFGEKREALMRGPFLHSSCLLTLLKALRRGRKGEGNDEA